MPETKRFLSQIWSSRFFVAFVFILFTDNFLQILRNSTHLLISLKKKKKRKEILRSNETGIIEAKKNNQESSSKFVIINLTLSFERRIDPNGSRSKNSGKKRNSRVYRKNFISDNEGEGEFLFLQLSPPRFIGSLEDLDEEFPPFDRGTKEGRFAIENRTPLLPFGPFFLSFHPSTRRWRTFPPSTLIGEAYEAFARKKRVEKNGERGIEIETAPPPRTDWCLEDAILRENAKKQKEGE